MRTVACLQFGIRSQNLSQPASGRNAVYSNIKEVSLHAAILQCLKWFQANLIMPAGRSGSHPTSEAGSVNFPNARRRAVGFVEIVQAPGFTPPKMPDIEVANSLGKLGLGIEGD